MRDQRGKYGRYLAEIWIERNGGWINVNDTVVAAGGLSGILKLPRWKI